MALGVGARAPDATLHTKPRETVTVRMLNARGPLVLLFFPFAYSSVCTQEMCAIAEDYSSYRDLGAEVVGISVDSPYVNQKFARECNAAFPILSDFNKQAIEAYDVVRPDLNGLKDVAERAAFVIDSDGRIVYSWQGEHPGVMPPLDEIKAAVPKASTAPP